MVVRLWPSACTASMVQAFTVRPLSITVQAPKNGGFAADVGSGETGDIAQIVDEEQPGLDLGGVGLAVDGERGFVCHTRSTKETYRNRSWKQRGAWMWRDLGRRCGWPGGVQCG
jgi:hypothetical protein